MKLSNLLSGLSLCFAVLPLSAFASDLPSVVNYAEATFGCSGVTADTTVQPGVNLRTAQGDEVRIQGELASLLSLEGNQLVLHVGARQELTIGTLASAPTCDVTDAGEPATPSWNQILISPNIELVLEHTAQYVLTITQKPDSDTSAYPTYQYHW